MDDMLEKIEQEAVPLANRLSLDRLKLSSIWFDVDYKRQDDGSMKRVSTKATIRAYGKVRKVAIGDGTEFSTYKDAEEATKKSLSEYYKNIRENLPAEKKLAERLRQKRYRKTRQLKKQEFRENQ